MGFAIPVNEAKPIIEQLISEKKIIRPSLGITGSTISKENAEKYDLPQGVYVHEVTAYGGAERAGIKQGDVITAFDGNKILTIDELVEEIAKHKVGDIVKLTVTDQFGKSGEIDVVLSERPEE
jgi:serine protease Do